MEHKSTNLCYKYKGIKRAIIFAGQEQISTCLLCVVDKGEILLLPYMSQTRRTARRPIFRSALYLQKPVPSHRQHVVSFITLLQESRPSYNCRQVTTFT